ncbi:DUF1996 domain-containing protein [Actinocrispum wychmicini]|uniref:Uncharacterized protein DUF1996 n=1 Tax=Actinocrispum wychmicini TaxID=1213861 RepID=A0A4R2JIA1_9PSEU|nr:DUF1996 domain-containing protein [Actinocrispum wychmicini]TCO56726.1 uncharacterized protein DUF1996 [Actinocrispum wychmicini]
MARSKGRHRISRRTKIAAAGVALTLAVGTLVLVNTAGDPATARADAAAPSFFVDITKVRSNVRTPREQRNASTGTFTVDCGENQNGHFNPDNFIAQPGVKNGAQHLHDYVGNLTTNADSNNKSLVRGGTTCKNGDQSAYFWPVIRIDREDDNGQSQQDRAKQEAKAQQRGQNNNGQNNQNQNNRGNNQNQGQGNAQNNDNQNQGRSGNQNNNQNQNNVRNQNDNNARNQGGNNIRSQNSNGAGNQDNNQAGQDDNAGQNNDNAGQQGAAQQNGGRLQRLRDLVDKVKQARQNQRNNGNDNNADQNNQDELPGVDDKNQVAGNDGEIVEPRDANITFNGSPVGEVVPMPKFLRILYGDAKVNENGPKNARDSWTCAGFEDRVLINKYPICPNGAAVKRIHAFPSCWDGQNTDSENHRDHIAFPDNNGRCRNGFVAVPQLTITLTYDIPQDVQQKGQYKVDSFPEEEHDPFSDHDDFANVMSNAIMNRVVDCINNGKTCNE